MRLGLQQYAVERFLYRLGRSRHRERFVLKGTTLLAIWGTAFRPTRDVDFTGYGSPDPHGVIEAFREIFDRSPAFRQFIEESHLLFRAHAEFRKADLDARQMLYQRLAERIWSPERLHDEAAS